MTNPTDAERKVSEQMQRISKKLETMLDKAAGEHVGFILLSCSLNNPEGRMNYVSNVDRKDAIKSLKELLEWWESEAPDIPSHEIQ